ncbi:MAG: GNAT family N-acetyltransferase [Firmicutes bacterium]|nr:GNAT family N-acetyltransferase [Bacillota bacterium]
MPGACNNYTLRTYRGGDESSIWRLWNQCLPKEGICWDQFLKKVLLDKNFDSDGAIVAEADGKIIGFAYCVIRRVPMEGTNLESDRGWLTVIFVHPDYRRRGIASAMLNEVYDFLAKHGRSLLAVSPYAPNYFWPGVDPEHHKEADEFFKEHGFKVQSAPHAMEADLRFFSVPEEVSQRIEELEKEGIRIGYIEPRYYIPLFKTIEEHFSAEWLRVAREALERGDSPDNIVVASREKVDGSPEVVGWCQYGGYDNVPERFGPFGVISAMRGKQIGKALLYKCMETMRQKGLHSVWFLWTDPDSPAGHLYQKAGFRSYRQFHIYEKTLV